MTRAKTTLGAGIVGALGVVYGDIGTSPLYAFREAFHTGHLDVSAVNVYGVLSLIIWSLIIVITVKYLVFVMRADNHGEGGILALTALLLGKRKNPSTLRRGLRMLTLAGLFGTALLYGDGMITPAISVLSAVEGLRVGTSMFNHLTVPVAIVILVGLFAVQRHGTGSIGAAFGPVMGVWFTVLGALGVTQIVAQPAILGAFSPTHAITFFGTHPFGSFLALGAIFLVVTGGEALYADLAHFGAKPIRYGWLLIALPALTLNYLGQGALLLGTPSVLDNPFYRMAPSWMLWPLIVLATCATVIASQALISGAFSLTMQAVHLGYLPRIRIVHTSEAAHGQVYVPSVNWGLLGACVALVVGFGTSSALAAAYGVAVTVTMVITTILFAAVARKRWQWNRVAVGALVMLFGTIDLAFAGANLFKIAEGGWVPLAVGAVVFAVMTTWKTGRRIVAQRMRRDWVPLDTFLGSLAQHPPMRVDGDAIYMVSNPNLAPAALVANLRHQHVLHEHIYIVSIQVGYDAHVLAAQRATITHFNLGFTRILLRYGYKDPINVHTDLEGLGAHHIAFEPGVTYFLGRERIIATPAYSMAPWREHLYAFLHRNATNAAEFYNVPHDAVYEVGTAVEI